MYAQNDGFGGGDEVVGCLLFNTNRWTVAHGVINAWERVPYIYDGGLVRNYSKVKFNSTDVADVPSLQQLESGAFPGFDRAPVGVGSVVSPFRRIHQNFLIANYNADAAVLLDDGGSRFLQFGNVIVYGNTGVGESCHNSQWVYGIGNMYAYTEQWSLIEAEGPSPLGIRTFFNNNTFLNFHDSDWCKVRQPGADLPNLTQFWNNEVHSPGAKATGISNCNGGNNSLFGPMPDGIAIVRASAILAPFPKPATGATKSP